MERTAKMLIAVLAGGLLGCAAVQAQNEAPPAETAGRAQGRVSLTIYSNADPQQFDPQQFISQQRMGNSPQFAWQVPGFGVVRDTRTLDLKQGANTVDFTDVPQFIDPTTVSLTDLSVPPEAQEKSGLQVVEQQFQFDLVSAQKLLAKYLDQPIRVNINLGNGQRETVAGTLLSASGGQLVLKTDKGVRLINNTGDVQLGELPGGLITRPTLQWQLWAPAAGNRRVVTAYQTAGITWRADYNLVLSADDTRADLGAWVTIMNLSGTSYPDAQVKLIAGDVQRVAPRPGLYGIGGGIAMERGLAAAAPAGFAEKSFFEYHLYTLGHRTTVPDNSTQQIALFPTVQGVKVEKVLVYYGLPDSGHWFFPSPQTDRNLGNQSNKKVDVYIRFENTKENHLGIPLPAGKVRVYKADGAATGGGTGALEFIGENLIDHTPRDQKVLLKIGQAFDVTGERTQMDFKIDNAHDWMEETIRIVIRNAKDKPQDVLIRENLYRWTNWKIIKKTDDYEKVDARTIHFPVTVPANGRKTVEYTVKYTW